MLPISMILLRIYMNSNSNSNYYLNANSNEF